MTPFAFELNQGGTTMESNTKQPRRWQRAPLRVTGVLLVLVALAAVLAACAPITAPAESGTATETTVATAVPAAEPRRNANARDPSAAATSLPSRPVAAATSTRTWDAPAGGNKFEGPFGVVYAPNITSDPETGIGNWSETDIVNALHLGVRPDGSQLHPIMPYMAMSNLADQDAYDLAAALKQLPPVVNAVPADELTTPPAPFTPAQTPPAVAPIDGAERGAYIVSVANCSRCHTPRGADGRRI